MPLDPTQLAPVLAALGCPQEKCREMAEQLDKRAKQLSEQRGQPYDEAMTHLLKLMAQGWAAPKNLQDEQPQIHTDQHR